MPYCSKCGTENEESSMFCGKCGQRLKEPEETKEPQPKNATDEIKLERLPETTHVKLKSIGIGVLLNFIISGLGLVYVYECALGVFFILIELIITAIMVTYPDFMTLGVILWIIAFAASSYLSYISIVAFNKKTQKNNNN